MVQRNDRKGVMHLVSPFRSKRGNEMQEMIVFLMPFHNGPFLKEVSVMLKVELKLNIQFIYNCIKILTVKKRSIISK